MLARLRVTTAKTQENIIRRAKEKEMKEILKKISENFIEFTCNHLIFMNIIGFLISGILIPILTTICFRKFFR